MSLDWVHLAVAVVSAIIGAFSGLVAGVWRVARIDQAIRIDFNDLMSAARTATNAKIETLVGQFQDSFAALRQKINDVELNTEKHFMSKDGFAEFRDEYRRNMELVFEKLDRLQQGPR